jgi:hypothetical protein
MHRASPALSHINIFFCRRRIPDLDCFGRYHPFAYWFFGKKGTMAVSTAMASEIGSERLPVEVETLLKTKRINFDDGDLT